MSAEPLQYRRQKAIDDLLRLMGCTDPRASNCEHVGAVTALASAIQDTTFDLLDEAVGRALSQFGLRPQIETRIKPGVTGHREGVLRGGSDA